MGQDDLVEVNCQRLRGFVPARFPTSRRPSPIPVHFSAKLVVARSSSAAKMPDIPVGAQTFDLAFHPNRPLVLSGLLTGHIKAFSYDEQGSYQAKFSVRPSKRSCRTLAVSEDGAQVWAGGKAKAIQYVFPIPLQRQP